MPRNSLDILNRIPLINTFMIFFAILSANFEEFKLDLDKEKITALLTTGLNEHGVFEKVDSKLVSVIGGDINMLAKFRKLAYHYRLYLLSAIDEDSEKTVQYAKLWSQDIMCITRASSDAETSKLTVDIPTLTHDYEETLLNAQLRADSRWRRAPKQYHQFLKEC